MSVITAHRIQLPASKLLPNIWLAGVRSSTLATVLDMTEVELKAWIRDGRKLPEQVAKLRTVLELADLYIAATGNPAGYDDWLSTHHLGTMMLFGSPADVLRTAQPDNAHDILVAYLRDEYGDELRWLAS